MKLANGPDDIEVAFATARLGGQGRLRQRRGLSGEVSATPRHIEIQVFGDGKAARCIWASAIAAIQRRHQKVLEEAPSPVIDAEDPREDRQGLRRRHRADQVFRCRHDRVPVREGRILPSSR